MASLTFLFFTASLSAFANEPKLFDADPICDNLVELKKEFAKSRAIHLSSPALRPSVNDQNKWFRSVTEEMAAICNADKTFAVALHEKKKGVLTGQCKPAQEAASYDQKMLDHSEANIKKLKTKKEAFLLKGIKGVTDSLPMIAGRNVDLIDDLAFDLRQVDLKAYCELRWLYPSDLLTKLHAGSIERCPNLTHYQEPKLEDKNDPSLFAKLMHRFELSITYNASRKAKATAAALSSQAIYEKCIAENPEVKSTLPVGKKAKSHANGSGTHSGKSSKEKSDITGTAEDQQKRKK